MTKHKKCFAPSECCTSSCPNVQCDMAAEKWGDYQVAADAGYEKIRCKDCRYMTGKCEDCMFYNEPRFCDLAKEKAGVTEMGGD